MKVKFITCIYNNLYGTEYGGRPSREHHYKLSVLSLLKITDASFVLYTSSKEYDEIVRYFFTENSIDPNHLTVKKFDLTNSKYYKKIRKVKDLEKSKKSDRCYEIQYNKFYWLKDEIDDLHTHFYWIDAGLSHTGLFPPKYKIDHEYKHREYYDFSLFNNIFLNNLINITEDRIFILGKDNTGVNYWSQSLPEKYYDTYDNSIHVVGGLFGGSKNNVSLYVDYFDKILLNTLNLNEIYYEELLMSAIYFNNKNKFIVGYFQTWWYDPAGPYPEGHEFYANNKPFYKIFEDLQ
jgi:hypothetical protein